MGLAGKVGRDRYGFEHGYYALAYPHEPLGVRICVFSFRLFIRTSIPCDISQNTEAGIFVGRCSVFIRINVHLLSGNHRRTVVPSFHFCIITSTVPRQIEAIAVTHFEFCLIFYTNSANIELTSIGGADYPME